MVKDKSVNGMKEKKTLFGNMTYSEYADLMTALSRKEFLTVQEAAFYFHIGINRMYTLINHEVPDADFIIPNGDYRLISREKFKDFVLAGNLKKKNKTK